MSLFKKRNELEILDERLIKSQVFCDRLIEENERLQEKLIAERNELFAEKRRLEIDKAIFGKEKENAFRAADMKYEHLEAELEFIKKHRMLPAECKFFTKMPRVPQSIKKLRGKKND